MKDCKLRKMSSYQVLRYELDKTNSINKIFETALVEIANQVGPEVVKAPEIARKALLEMWRRGQEK